MCTKSGIHFLSIFCEIICLQQRTNSLPSKYVKRVFRNDILAFVQKNRNGWSSPHIIVTKIFWRLSKDFSDITFGLVCFEEYLY